MWHLVSKFFPDTQLTKFYVYLLVDRGFLPPVFLWSIAGVSSTYRIDAPDNHRRQTEKQTNEQTNGRVSLFVCLFVCDVDGVWHTVSVFFHENHCDVAAAAYLLQCLGRLSGDAGNAEMENRAPENWRRGVTNSSEWNTRSRKIRKEKYGKSGRAKRKEPKKQPSHYNFGRRRVVVCAVRKSTASW